MNIWTYFLLRDAARAGWFDLTPEAARATKRRGVFITLTAPIAIPLFMLFAFAAFAEGHWGWGIVLLLLGARWL
jgi:hypothetical protein